MLVNDVFDPGEVYLAGTLAEGACYLDALAHWSSPGSAVTGFDCYFDNARAKIRPTDGRLLYTNTFEDELREFHCDDCPYAGAYPNAPLANDPVIQTPPCTGTSFYSFLVAPSGGLFYTCNQTTWYDGTGAVAYTATSSDLPLHLGFGDLLLTKQHVVHLKTLAATPITGLPERTIDTVRAVQPDSFLVVLAAAQSASDGSSQELWQIDAGGAATMLGTFPPLPPGAKSVAAYTSKLDVHGGLLQFGSGPAVFQDIIVRRDISGGSAVVYDEANDPLVKIHISSLVTGP